MTNFYKGIIVFLMSFFFSVTSLHAQPVNVTSVTVTSPPATTCTNTNVTVSGMNNASNFIHNGNNFTVSGFNITIDIEYLAGIVVLPAFTPFTQNVNLGMLPIGTYTVTTNGKLNSAIQSTLVTTLVVGSCCPAVPSFTLSDTSMCPGDTVTMTSTSTGATGQTWYENNIFKSHLISYTSVPLTIPGTYTYRLVVDDGSCFDTLDKVVTVHSFPTIDLGNDTAFCDGSTLVLDAGAGRDSMLWSTSATTRQINVGTVGQYKVEVFEEGCSSIDSIFISSKPAPIVDLGVDTIICDGDSIQLDVPILGATFNWHDGSTSAGFIAKDSGIIWVNVTSVNGCSATDSIVIGIKDCTPIGLQDNSMKSSFSSYPNPAKNLLNIRLPDNIEKSNMLFELFDLKGRHLTSITLQTEANVAELRLPDLPAGIYVIKMSDVVQQWVGKVSIE